MKNKDKRLEIRTNSDVFEMLKSICTDKNMTKSEMIRRLIVDKYYDLEREKYEK